MTLFLLHINNQSQKPQCNNNASKSHISCYFFFCVSVIFGAIGDGLFAHLYLNDMDNLLSLEFQENVLYTNYKTVNTTIGYSYWLLIGATIVLRGAVILSPLEKRSDRTSIQKVYLSHVTNTVLPEFEIGGFSRHCRLRLTVWRPDFTGLVAKPCVRLVHFSVSV